MNGNIYFLPVFHEHETDKVRVHLQSFIKALGTSVFVLMISPKMLKLRMFTKKYASGIPIIFYVQMTYHSVLYYSLQPKKIRVEVLGNKRHFSRDYETMIIWLCESFSISVIWKTIGPFTSNICSQLKINLLSCWIFCCGTGSQGCLVRYSIEHNESNVNSDESQRKMISSSSCTVHVNQLSHIGSFMWTTETQQITGKCSYD